MIEVLVASVVGTAVGYGARWYQTQAPAPILTPLFAPLPPSHKTCPRCGQDVAAWRAYADGTVRCVACEPILRGASEL